MEQCPKHYPLPGERARVRASFSPNCIVPPGQGEGKREASICGNAARRIALDRPSVKSINVEIRRIMRRHFDHVDLRVPRLADVTPFYELLLPALGFSRRKGIEGWLEFEVEDESATEFFGVTESDTHVVNENRIAFWAETRADVDRVAGVAARAGARNIEGPMDYASGYYAVFFEDPCGNRLEVCHRVRQ